MANLWSGIALPWNNTVQGTLDWKEDIDVLKSSVLWILLTRMGERVMLRDFGSRVPDALFEPNVQALAAEVASAVQTAIERWVDRIAIVEVIPQVDGNVLRCIVSYRIAGEPGDAPEKFMTVPILPLAGA